MAVDNFQRKITAIMSADVVGYSKLMGDDEASTVQTLAEYKSVMSALIEQHRGRVVDSPGDNMLSEFASVVDAVQCGVAIQKELKSRNNQLPENRKMRFRIGINLGDVIQEKGRIYGDGVNIAARLEALADPGGICVSKTAFDHIETKLPLGYEFLGNQEVKNISKPIGAYRVLMEPRVTIAGDEEDKPGTSYLNKKLVIVGAITILSLIIGFLSWLLYIRTPKIEPVSTERMAFSLPDKPSIVVLPFKNMSGEPGQEYFSDGISDEIITALSKIEQLFVIAKHSAFSFKGKPIKIQQVAEELGVHYVLEGSVRKSGDKVRVTVQLVDAVIGTHIWTERYDRKLEDIFVVQDDITQQILTALRVKLTEGDQARIYARGTNNLNVLLKSLQARQAHHRLNKTDNLLAQNLYKEAIALDPDYAVAYVGLGFTYLAEIGYGSDKSREELIDKALQLAQKALELDNSNFSAHQLLGLVYEKQGDNEKAMLEAERALSLAPNAADAYAGLCKRLYVTGRYEEALAMMEKAIRLDPIPPKWYYTRLGIVNFLLERYDEAVEAGKKGVSSETGIYGHIILAAAYSLLDRQEAAHAEAAEIIRINPNFSLETFRERSRVAYKKQADIERFYEGLRKAGLK